ncbi:MULTISPECIES: DEAD/DEAH box helicase [Enterobacteriaceae]|uniref:DEAD/DEAH box helicase n=1 Tax=Enterobacteriaceae TaxID=543 RepID=UPI001883ACDF|nr:MULTISPECIES: DEAD/DEAH box helicase [Enterobacteriaceae]MBE9966525.1 DEAD/DEAH box helicase [Citrobacter freundii]MBE9976969.1 DEAD/DEAH box helicase [Citrobacter freundii]MBE9986504.1 DEAD/DEAH box helicase [Citrobacter freundii]MBF0065872.1 DEAD/DEAH box helicase [Citrobacter freundii]MCE1461814.1 DEAD/DEAH box helicase [Enterobacter roggenkampii]
MNEQNYAPGMRVVIRDAEWRIRRADNSGDGGHLLICDGISELVRGKEGLFLTGLEENIEILDPAKTKLVEDDSANYQASQLYIESQLRQRVPTDNLVHFGHNAAMDSMPFQLDPTRMALAQPRQRILIADAVGLGKTLEAGILVSELIRRSRGKRILVLAVKSMLTQFQKEFWSRFAIPLTRLDSAGLQKVRNRIPTNHNPFHYFDKTIISIDTLKQDIEYRHHLENAWWDIIVIDEAHNVAERGTSSLRSKLAKLLAGRSDTLIMLSATPHDGKAESFASLMNMLDPTAIANPKEYEYADFADKNLVVRRFKKDVKDQMAGEFPEREIKELQREATSAEEEVYRRLLESKFRDDDDEDTSANKGRLFKITLEKALFSSPMACASVVANRLKRLESRKEINSQSQINELHSLLLALNNVDASQFSKYQLLLETIRSDLKWKANNSDDRLVIFTESIKTLEFLHQQLLADLKIKPEQVATLRGDQGDTVLMETVEAFGKQQSPLRLLICSDVASEGINLHHLSHKMVHFDIPWSLMVFQQRNGRIDRYGQKHVPQIRYLLTEANEPQINGDMRVLQVLINKDEQAQKNIGDSSEFTGKFTQEEEEEQVADHMMQGSDNGADLFEQLLNSNVGESAEHDLFSELSNVVSNDIQSLTATDTSLFADEQTYCEKALGYLKASGQRIQYETLPDNTLSLVAPEELRRRFNQLPPEITPENGQLYLSQDKKVITDSIIRSRGEQHAWPDIHYLWQINPVVQWLDDKMQSAFGRHQAPVIRLPHLFSPDEDHFILSGLFPNRKSHPMVNSWLVVSFNLDQLTGSLPFAEFLANNPQLGKKLTNAGGEQRNHQRQQQLLEKAIDHARDVFAHDRQAFEDKINQQLNEHLEKLEKLKGRQIGQLEMDFAENKQQESVKQSRKEQRQREIEHNFNSYIEWIEDTMTTEKEPYIHVIAVITGAEG